MDHEDSLDVAMRKHMYLWRIHQCLLSAGETLDEIADQLDDDDEVGPDPLMIELSSICEGQNLEWISQKLHGLADKAATEAVNIKGQIRKLMAANPAKAEEKKRKRNEEAEEASEESNKTHDEEVAVESESKPGPSKKRKHA